MSALYLLILVSLLIALGFLAAYLWAVRSGQYDDTCTPALRLLTEDPPPNRAAPAKDTSPAPTRAHPSAPTPPPTARKGMQ